MEDSSTSELLNIWSPPVYDISHKPTLLHTTGLRSSRYSSGSTQVRDIQGTLGEGNDFARIAKWCPDGSTALAQCESGCLQFLDLPPELLDQTLSQALLSSHILKRTLPQPSPVLDFAWYPYATCRDPATFCYVTSVRESPVKLLDASDGRLRASYKIVDHRERQVAPHSLVFNPTATKLYCGFDSAIEVFDLHSSAGGEGLRLKTTPNRKSKDGLKGIISALAFSPSGDSNSSIFAAGSLSPSASNGSNIALFSEEMGEVPIGFLGIDGAGGVRSSVMQLQFNPSMPNILYASFRRHPTIYAWDLRSDLGNVLQTFRRDAPSLSASSDVPAKKDNVETNQKMKFDIDWSGRWLGVGDTNGVVSLFDLKSSEEAVDPIQEEVASTSPPLNLDDTPAEHGYSNPPDGPKGPIGPTLQYRAHQDTIGSIGFHPLRPILLSVSGSRHFHSRSDSHTSSSDDDHFRSPDSSDTDTDTDESDGMEEDDVDAIERGDETMVIRRYRVRPQPVTRDDSIKLWSFE